MTDRIDGFVVTSPEEFLMAKHRIDGEALVADADMMRQLHDASPDGQAEAERVDEALRSLGTPGTLEFTARFESGDERP